jgi:hypothetical protein
MTKLTNTLITMTKLTKAEKLKAWRDLQAVTSKALTDVLTAVETRSDDESDAVFEVRTREDAYCLAHKDGGWSVELATDPSDPRTLASGLEFFEAVERLCITVTGARAMREILNRKHKMPTVSADLRVYLEDGQTQWRLGELRKAIHLIGDAADEVVPRKKYLPEIDALIERCGEEARVWKIL